MMNIHDLKLGINGAAAMVCADLRLAKGEKAGLIGRNGSGKSTLLAALAARASGLEQPEYASLEGEVTFDRGAKVEYVPQEWRAAPDVTVSECLGDSANLAPKGLLAMKLRELSGGWLKFAQLARAFACGADVLLLDEPTNNLDAERVDWFVEAARSSSAAILLVSHDRYVLDRIVTAIYEIDPATREIKRYGGNYSFFRDEKDKESRARAREYAAQNKRRKRLAESLGDLRDHAKRIEAETKHYFYRKRAAKLAMRAARQKTRLESELSEVARPQNDRTVRFEVRNSDHGRAGQAVALAKDAGFAYGETQVFRGLNLNVRGGERVRLVGPNGSGKSTLLRLIGAGLPPTSGSLETFGRIGYLPQSLVVQDPRVSVARHLEKTAGFSMAECGDAIGHVLAKNPESVSVGELSEGELKIMRLATLLYAGCDLLALDEPTNHLDVYAIEALEKALEHFFGAVIFVSHDRLFAERVGGEKIVDLGVSR